MKEVVQEIGAKLKNFFISENSNLTELEIKEAAFAELHEITGDDEVWLVQCPTNLETSNLLNNKIKLPGKTSLENLETIAVEYKNPKTLTFGCKRKKNYSLKNINFDGSIVIREKLQTVKKEKEFELPKQEKVPFPDNLKERHPLLGYRFEESITLPGNVLAKLKKAEGNFRPEKKSSISEIIKIEETDDEVLFVKTEKRKSKKRKTAGDDSQPKKKKSKKTKEDSDDIQWIQNI